MIEQLVTGTVYRFFIVAGRVVAISHCLPANVEGDGIFSISDLVKLKNAERRLNPTHAAYPLQIGRRERRFLRQSGFKAKDTPEAGKLIFLGSSSNDLAGDTIDATDAVHLSYSELVIRAVSLVPDLSVCGADVVIVDASKPATGQGYSMLELNTGRE